MNNIGIYKITNKINKKVYIGQSVNIHKRKLGHFNKLKHNRHHNKYLQNSFAKYGIENFDFEILCYCLESELDDKEKEYIAFYESTNRNKGYNLMYGGQGGRKFSTEVIEMFRKNRIGKKLTKEHCANISKGRKGIKLSNEAIEKIRETKKRNKSHCGEKNHNSNISNKIAEKIIKDLLKNISIKDISKKYEVNCALIYNIMYNVNYKEVLPNVREELKNRTKKLQTNKVNKAIEMYINGMSQNSIAKELGISRNTLRKELKYRNINTKIHKNQYLKQANTEVSK